ncbi:KTSC domain-containing protein [Gordonia sp. CPCC 205333]|uniref:KTSC domain-containing protein n=1 Tax=Gordonia sp. CPCC 205333 TaxID=3140790 RepID=UPI003AF3EF67
MHRTPVSSSSLTSVGYDEKAKTLEVEFNSGSVYQYFDVPASTHLALLGANSVGRYFSLNVRDVYRHRRL